MQLAERGLEYGDTGRRAWGSVDQHWGLAAGWLWFRRKVKGVRKETNSGRSPRKYNRSSAAKPRRRTEASLGERLVDSMKELRAHLRGEIQLSETIYHVPPETDVRALRKTLGLSQSDFAALFGFNVRSVQDWEQGRRRPEIPIRAYLAVIRRDPQAVIRALRAA